MHTTLMRLLALLMVLALVAAACGGDDTDAATDETQTTDVADDGEGALDGSGEDADDGEGALAGSEDDGEGALDGVSHEDSSPDDLEIWQTDLNAVGCWAGPVDGTLGPRTEAAIIAFQTAKGLEADGLLGPITKGALEDAVAAGEIVCEEGAADDGEGAMGDADSGADDGDGAMAGSGDDGEGAMDGAAVATFSAADVMVDLPITACDNPTESTLNLSATDGTGELIITATDGTGDITFFDDSGEWVGTVESVSVGDAGNLDVTGTISQPGGGGDVAFEVTGSCAG